MSDNTKNVSISTYQEVIELKKKGKLIADIATILRLSKSEVQKIIMHFDNLFKNPVEK